MAKGFNRPPQGKPGGGGMMQQIKAMQEVEKNPGKAAPAGWKPGDKLIETGKEFIGAY